MGAELLDALAADLGEGPDRSNRFLSTLDEILHRWADAGDEVWRWQEAISALRDQVASHVAADAGMRERTEALWRQARVLIGARAHYGRTHQ